MAEDTQQAASQRGRSRRERVEIARSRDILDVANELNMELFRSGRDYRWKEHDSMVISPDKNMWNWFSRHQGGDVIALVETMKEINFNQAIDYLNDGSFKEFTAVERVQEPFNYYLQPYEQPFNEARQYLKDNRGLSDDTIDFFLEKGVLAQANAKLNDSIEPVVVFKTLSSSGEIVGATLQGIEENWDKWPERGYAKNIVRNSDGMNGLHVDIGQPNRLVFTESPIDLMSYYEVNKDKLSDVRLVSMDGLKESTIGRHLAQLQSELSGRPLTWSDEQLAEGLQTAIDNHFFDGKNKGLLTLAVDNDEGGRNFIEDLQAKGAAIIADLPELQLGQTKTDWNDALKAMSIESSPRAPMLESSPVSSAEPEQKEKSLDNHQETNTGGELFNRSSSSLGEISPGTAPKPVGYETQPDFPTNVPLYFNIDRTVESSFRLRRGYSYPKNRDIRNLNLYASDIQKSAQFYLNELAGSTVTYFYQDGGKQAALQVNFEKRHWMHLTGLSPVYLEKLSSVSETFIDEIATGQTNFQNMTVGRGYLDKIQTLPLLPEVLETDAFVFDDLSSIEKFGRLDAKAAIRSDDQNIVLAFQVDAQEEMFPASLLSPSIDLNLKMDNLSQEKTILGVFVEKDGVITKQRINEEYISDDGLEMLNYLEEYNQKKQTPFSDEPIHDLTPSPAEALIDAATFTQVLDTAYNVGNPAELGVAIPEEFQASWERYSQLSEVSSGDFKTIVAKADELGLLDKTSAFYQDWQQDQIYNDTYHVRLRGTEEGLNSPQLPFEPTRLVSYQDFVTELYKANQDVSQTQPITFDIYAPGGALVKEGVRYAISDETQPVSRLLGLGYRRLEGYPDLAAIDEEVLSQLDNQALNQEIEQEANNPKQPLELEPEKATVPPAVEKPFTSPKQEMKGHLAKRVDDILAHDKEAPKEQALAKGSPEKIDYSQVSAHDLSEIAFQKVREFTQSPEELAEYMDFMSKFPQLSPRNVALIQDQWRGANAVATYNQWQALGKTLGLEPSDVIETKNTYTNKRTGETKEVVHQSLSVKSGEHAQITLFRPLMVKMIPVLDDQGRQMKNDKGNPKFKKWSEATPQEKALVKEGKLKMSQFQERDLKTGLPKFTTYKVFELSQTTLKPESYPKAMPNRHYQFDTDQVKTKEVLDGLCDYAGTLGVSLLRDERHELGNAKGAFYPGEQKILLNPDNLPGEQIATTIHELAHATLHNPKFTENYKEDVSKGRKELEAEMTSHLVSKHFGLDTSEKAIDYMASWTKNLSQLDDKQLADSMKRIHQTVSRMVNHIEHHTKPYQPTKNRGQSPNFPQSPTKGLNR